MSDPLSVTSRRTDRVYATLAASERRAVLRALAAIGAPTEVGELARRVADSAAPAAGRPSPARIGLHHRHLPMMADAGIVDYDPACGRVALTDRGHRAVAVLACAAERLAGDPA